MRTIRQSAILAATASLSLLASGTALATPIYTSWGSLPGATFGGNGIPNDAVAKTDVFVNGTTQVTLALTAHQRYSNPAVTNNGAGDYYAGTGSNCGIATDPVGCPSASQGALWNFAYYISVSGTDPNFNDFSDFTFTLYYDFDPGTGTAFGSLGKINVDNALTLASINPATVTLWQDSQNLMFSGFSTAVPFTVTPPTYGAFNPNATGEYNFYIGFTANNLPAYSGAVGIDVNVVPVPAAAWLFASGVGALGWLRRRSRATA